MITILIPTDFSDSARNALEYGLALYGPDQQYVLLNSYEEPRSTTSSMISLKDILHESSVDSLNEEKAEILQKHPGLNILTVSEYGDPADSILNYARNHDADVIVMGTDGLSGFKKLVLGSVASAVLQKANEPVIVVPRDYSYVAPKSILYTADLQNEPEVNFKDVFTDIVDRNKSKITILTVKEPGQEIDIEEAEKGFALHLSMNGYDHQFDVVEDENVGQAIRDYSDSHDVNLMVTTPRQSSWFQRLLKHSVSSELAEHIRVPMMAMH